MLKIAAWLPAAQKSPLRCSFDSSDVGSRFSFCHFVGDGALYSPRAQFAHTMIWQSLLSLLLSRVAKAARAVFTLSSPASGRLRFTSTGASHSATTAPNREAVVRLRVECSGNGCFCTTSPLANDWGRRFAIVRLIPWQRRHLRLGNMRASCHHCAAFCHRQRAVNGWAA